MSSWMCCYRHTAIRCSRLHSMELRIFHCSDCNFTFFCTNIHFHWVIWYFCDLYAFVWKKLYFSITNIGIIHADSITISVWFLLFLDVGGESIIVIGSIQVSMGSGCYYENYINIFKPIYCWKWVKIEFKFWSLINVFIIDYVILLII